MALDLSAFKANGHLFIEYLQDKYILHHSPFLDDDGGAFVVAT